MKCNRRVMASVISMAVFVVSACAENDSTDTSTIDHAVSNAFDQPQHVCHLLLDENTVRQTQNERYSRLVTQYSTVSNQIALVEKLGWILIDSARRHHDDGFYSLALTAAQCIDTIATGQPEARLLQAYSLHQLHQFERAREVAQNLVDERGHWLDFAVLGDVMLDLGDLEAAARHYESMMTLKPGVEAFTRVAEWRYKTGDLSGAIAVLKKAVTASRNQQPHVRAWLLTRLATYAWQRDGAAIANAVVAKALAFDSENTDALLLRARLLQSAGDEPQACLVLSRAVSLSESPLLKWALLDSLMVLTDTTTQPQAGKAECVSAMQTDTLVQDLKGRGAIVDPLTVAQYLVTQQEDAQLALRLVRNQSNNGASLDQRRALGWAQYGNQQFDEAWTTLSPLVERGEPNPRLFFHAGVVAHARGDIEAASALLDRAQRYQFLLMHSEKKRLAAVRRSVRMAATS